MSAHDGDKDDDEGEEEVEEGDEGDDAEGDDDGEDDENATLPGESKRTSRAPPTAAAATTNGDEEGEDDEGDEGDEGDDDEEGDEHDEQDVASAITAATGAPSAVDEAAPGPEHAAATAATEAAISPATAGTAMMDMPDEGESKYTTLRTNTMRSPDIGRTPAAYVPASPAIGDGLDDDMTGVPPGLNANPEGKDGAVDGGGDGDDDEQVNFESHAQYIIYPDDVIRTDLKKQWNKVPTEVFGVFEETKDVKDMTDVKADDAARRLREKEYDSSLKEDGQLSDAERELSVKLIAAADSGQYWEATRLLLIDHTIEAPGPWINYSDPETGDNALMRAAQRGDLNMIQLLYAHSVITDPTTGAIIKRDLHVDHTDYYKQTALMKASRAGHFCVVKFLVKEAKAKAFGVFDNDGWNALMHASARGHWHIVELLTVYAYQEKNPDFQYEIIAQQSKAGQNALMLAAANGYVNIVRFFLETTDYGQNDKQSGKIMSINPATITTTVNSTGRPIPKFVDNQGMHPLWLAVKYGRLYVVHYLLSKGADPGPEPGTPLFRAAEQHQQDQEAAAAREAEAQGLPPPESVPLLTAWNVPLDESVALRKPPVDRKMLNEAIKLGIKDCEDEIARLLRHVRRPQKYHNFQEAVLRLAKAQRYLADAVVATKQGQHESSWILTEHAERVTSDELHLTQEIAIRDEAKQRLVERKARWEQSEGDIALKRRKLFKTLAESHLSLGKRYLQQGEYIDSGRCLRMAEWFAPKNKDILKAIAELEVAQAKKPGAQAAKNKQERGICFSLFGF